MVMKNLFDSTVYLDNVHINGRPFPQTVGHMNTAGTAIIISAKEGPDKERLLDLIAFVGDTIKVYDMLQLELTATSRQYPPKPVHHTVMLNGYSTVFDCAIIRFISLGAQEVTNEE